MQCTVIENCILTMNLHTNKKKNSSIYSYEVCNNIIISIIIIWSLVICGQDKKQDNITVQLYICVYYMPESHTHGHGHKVFSVKNKQILDMLCHTHTHWQAQIQTLGSSSSSGWYISIRNQSHSTNSHDHYYYYYCHHDYRGLWYYVFGSQWPEWIYSQRLMTIIIIVNFFLFVSWTLLDQPLSC